MELLYFRMIYVIITTAISGYFSPQNKESYSIKKNKFRDYLKEDLVKTTMEKSITKNLDFKRKILFYLLKYKMFFLVSILAKIKKR